MTTSHMHPGAGVFVPRSSAAGRCVPLAPVPGSPSLPVLLERLRDVSLLRSSLQARLEEVHAARVSLTK